MARRKSNDIAQAPLARTLSSPGVYFMRMLIFLLLVGFIAAILFPQFYAAFKANPGLNGLIIFVLFVGIVYAFWQVFRLNPEIRWVNAFRIADPGPRDFASTRAAGPNGDDAARSHRGAVTVDDIDALHYGQHRLAP